ncbi:hypothetical protein GGR51DRAFT_577589 [Nemania sp. FL0031]|nr:hypothetical protein GGR51DRAFT_577589 [Nemania sp. FL0031]
METRSRFCEQDLSTNEGYALAGVLDHSNDLVDRVIAATNKSKWSEHEPEVVPKLFRAINEEVGKRRLFVCCDGTWVNASGTTAPLTNVARFARAIDRFGLNPKYPGSPVTQVIYYSAGIGSEPVLKTRVDGIYSGITGAGLEEDILNAYCFLCNHYNFSAQNDEIILIGFSRGAFTVRCLADFISQVGLLQRKTLPFLSVLFQRWMDAREEADREKMKVDIRDMRYAFSLPVKITVLAEWDTVSAIGHVGWSKKFSFMKETVPENVQNAFLGIALNERRGSFKPMVYTRARSGTNVAQCAFSGCHSDIGGGNLDAGLSTVSLLWMVAKVQGACKVSFDRGALLQMIQPPRPSTKWWYGRKVDETTAMNLLWSKGTLNESLQGVWYIPHVLTLGWSSGSRRRHFRRTFKRCELKEKQEQNEKREAIMPRGHPQASSSAKLYKSNYNSETTDDLVKTASEDVTGKLKESITSAKNKEFLTASVKTAVHVSDTERSSTRLTAVIDATFGAYPGDDQARAYQDDIAQINNTAIEAAVQGTETVRDYIQCGLKIHFTVKELVKELKYRSKEGTLEGLSEKLGWLGHERHQLVDYLPQESYDENERILWDEWKSQVDMWHASNEGQKGGWDQDVMYWSDVLARFDKGDDPEALARKDLVQWEVCTNQLCRIADATAAAAQAGLQTTVENVAEAGSDLESAAARTVTKVAEIADMLKGSEDDTLKKVWSIMDDVKGAFERVPGEVLTGTLAKVIAGVTQAMAGNKEKGVDAPRIPAKESGAATHRNQVESPETDIQTAIRIATGQLAGIAGDLAQTLEPPTPDTISAVHNSSSNRSDEDDDYHDWGDGVSKAKEAADRMVEGAKALQNVGASDSASWEAMKTYALRAKEAAERAAKSIANATVQWKLTDEQRREALCYRITYPYWNTTRDGDEKRG